MSNIYQGLECLKNHPKIFSSYIANLDKKMCVTCGTVPLKECDNIYGMCTVCLESINVTSEKFDEIFFVASSSKKS